MTETVRWPLVQAKWYTAVDQSKPRKVRLIVIHDMEAPETKNTAENVAKYFQNPLDGNGRPVKASAHICIDNNSIVQCVRDRDVAYAAPGANSDGIQIELAGYGKQKKEEWLDFYGIALLAWASDAAAQYCIKYGIPARHLTNAQLRNGAKGIVGHYQVSEVYKKSDHSDPGAGFPWSYFIDSVNNFIQARKAA